MYPPSSHQDRPSVSLVLPAWNESDVIASAIDEAEAALREIADCYEIIVVDDGSTDDTSALVQQAARRNPSVKLLQHSPNQGYGAALRSGFAAASMDLVAFTDADCQFDLSELDRFLLLSKRYDIVCGYRIDRKDTPLRCLYSKGYNLLVRILLGTGVRDVDCALKMFRRDVAKDLRISGNGFLVNSELLVQAHRQGRSVVEVGVSHRPRTAGSSTVSIHHIPKVLTALARYWWNEAQFPGRAAVPTQSTRAPHRTFENPVPMRWLQIGLLLIAAIFMLTNLNYPLIDRDETRYAEIPREMIATGNWILPQLNFQTYYDKPPMLYWLCAISYKLFGVSEYSARLVSAFSALLTMAATMWFGSRNFGNRIGLLSGVVLMLSVGFAFSSRYLLLDGVLAFFTSMSLFTAYEAIKNRAIDASVSDLPLVRNTSLKREQGVSSYCQCNIGSSARQGQSPINLSWWLLSGVFVGLAFLTKGPLAIVLWLPPVFAMAWLSESFAKPRWWHYGLIALVTSAIALPWFTAVSIQDTHFVREFFVTHNFYRFTGGFHPKPLWYFVPVLLVAGHPWSFLTIPYTRFLFGRSETFRHQRPPLLGYLLLWTGWCLAFFSLSGCKLPTYLLPAAPALALMIGHYLDQLLHESSESNVYEFARFWSARSATATTCLAGVGFVAFVVVSQPNVSPSIYVWALLWAGLLVSSLLLLSDRHQAKFAWVSSAGVAFVFAVMVMHQLVPAYGRSQTLFGETSPLNEQLAMKSQPAMATIRHEFSEVPFYLGRGDIPNFADTDDDRIGKFVVDHPDCLLVVESRVTTEELDQQIPQGSLIQPIAKRGLAVIYQVSRRNGAPHVAWRKSVER
jgi:dolichol-phosphate mannosyltransferase